MKSLNKHEYQDNNRESFRIDVTFNIINTRQDRDKEPETIDTGKQTCAKAENSKTWDKDRQREQERTDSTQTRERQDRHMSLKPDSKIER